MTEEFINICDTQTDEFKALVDLILPRTASKEQAYRLLSFIDSVVSWYMMNSNEKQTFPIVYIPNAPDWAEFVCMKYLLLKMQFFGDPNYVNELKIQFRQAIDFTHYGVSPERQRRLLNEESKRRQFCKKAIKVFAKQNVVESQNLFILGQSAYNSVFNDNDLKKIFNTNHDSNTILISQSIIETESKLGSEKYKAIDNIFCFYAQGGDCETFNKINLENWSSLKNCFVFEFSKQPYCLNDILKKAKKLSYTFLNEEFFQKGKWRYKHFITLTEDESNYIFDREKRHKRHIFTNDDADQFSIECIRDLFKENPEIRMSRSLLQLCLNENLKNDYLTYLSNKNQEPLNVEWDMPIFNMITKFIQQRTQNIIEQLRLFAQGQKFAIVTSNSCPKAMRDDFLKLLQQEGLSAKIYNYNALKKQSGKNKNKIKEPKVVVLRFLSHYVNTHFLPKFPNSFDAPFLNEGQELIEFIDETAIIDYEKFKYDYDCLLNNLLASVFRLEILNDAGKALSKPQYDYISNYDDIDDDDNDRRSVIVPTIQFELIDRNARFPESELVLYQLNDNECIRINTLGEIKDNNQLSLLHSIQSVAELADTALDIFVNQNNRQNEMEMALRRTYVEEGIIPEEDILVEVPIWKYALKEKLLEKCIEKDLIPSQECRSSANIWELLKDKIDEPKFNEIYKEIGIKHCQKERLLKDWCDTTKAEPVAPGFRKDQKALMIDYLEMNKGILSFYRRKQIRTKNDTRKQNTITEGFLEEVLFNELTVDIVDTILNDEQLCDYLAIENKDDITTLKAIAEENINLKQIKCYTL